MSATRQDLSGYHRLIAPVEIVTPARGKETFADSRELFERLAELGRDGTPILQINQGPQAVDADGLAALNTLLALPDGLDLFAAAAAEQPGPARAKLTRWQWDFLGEYLDFRWQRAA